MSNSTAQGAVAKRPVESELEVMLNGQKNRLEMMLPEGLPIERLISSCVMSVYKTPRLKECSLSSLLLSSIMAAQWGLEVDTPLQQSHLVPVKIKGRPTAQLWPGYRGLIHLAMNSGEVAGAEARVVYEKDEFEFAYGDTPYIKHVPTFDEERGAFRCAYAVITLSSGKPIIEVMPRWQIERIRKGSPGGGTGPWVEHFDEMAKKTALKRALKLVPMSSQKSQRLASAIAADNEMEGGAPFTRDGLDKAKEVFGDAVVGDLGEMDPGTADPETAGNATLKADLRKGAQPPGSEEIVDPEPPESEIPVSEGSGQTVNLDDPKFLQSKDNLKDFDKEALRMELEQLLKDQGVEKYQSQVSVLMRSGAITTSVTGKMTKSDLLTVVAWLVSR